MMGPTLDEMSAFVTVLDRKSFTDAARHLGKSPARMSELVRNLEDRLDVRLVERTTRSVAATEAGERLLTRIRSLLDEYQAALDAMSDFREKPAGTLRLTVAPPAGHLVLTAIVPQFLAAYPEITLEISVSDRLIDIVAERYDAGIRPGNRLEGDMIAFRVSDDISFIHVAAPSYLAKHGTPKSPDDLMDHNCIRFRMPGGAIFPWRFGKQERLEAQFNGTLVVDDVIMAVRAAIDGVGILQILPQYVAREIAEGRVVTVLGEWAPPPFDGFYIFYSGRRQTRPALKALIAFLKEHYRKIAAEPYPKAGFFASSGEPLSAPDAS